MEIEDSKNRNIFLKYVEYLLAVLGINEEVIDFISTELISAEYDDRFGIFNKFIDEIYYKIR